MAAASPPQSVRLHILDLLRFVAILLVVFGHYTDAFNRIYLIVPENLKLNEVFRYGHISLCILFMISGYGVTMSSVNKNLKEFLITRLSRIYPIFWVSCLAGFLLPHLTSLPTFMPHASLKGLLTNLSLMPFLFHEEYLNPVFWTLIIELIFYGFIALIIAFRLWKFITPLIAVILMVCIMNAKTGESAALARYMPFFIAGMLLYFIQVHYTKMWILYALLALSLFSSLRGMKFLAAELRPSYTEPHAYHTSVIWALVILMFVGFLFIILKKLNLPNHPVYRILGNCSYPLYLFHLYWLPLYWYFRDTVQAQVLLIGLIVSMILVSWMINVYVELPFARLVRKTLSSMLFFNFGRKNEITL